MCEHHGLDPGHLTSCDFSRRQLFKATGAAVLTMALGLCGAVVMYALVEGVLLRPMPVRAQDRLIVAWKEVPSGGFHWPFQKYAFG